MSFLPVAHLELRTAARKPMTYYSRCITGLVALSTGLGFEIAGFNRAISTASAGLTVFLLLAGIGYTLLAAQAILLTCDCISFEKREGTLGLLFLTDLNGFDVVAGKLSAQVTRSLYGLLAALPAFGFCIVLGGVGPGDFVKVALALLNTLFYFATLGMLISACVWRERLASVYGGLALLYLGILLPMFSLNAGYYNLMAFVPAGSLAAALAPALALKSSPPFVNSLLVSHAMGWVFAAAAASIVRRTFVAGEMTAPGRNASRLRQTKSSSLALWLWAAKPRNPFVILSAMSAIWAMGIIFAVQAPNAWPVVAGTIVLTHWVLKFQAITQSSRMLAARRQSGELELLLTTPYDEDGIVRTCLHELKMALFWPTLVALAADFVAAVVVWTQLGFFDGLPCALLVLGEVVWMLVNLFSLSWMALHLGLKLANPAKAAASAVFCILLLPWAASVAFAAMASLLVPGPRFGPEFGPPVVLVFVFFLVFCNTYFTGNAISALRDHFREIVSETWARK